MSFEGRLESAVPELASVEREEIPSSLRPFTLEKKSEGRQYLIATAVIVVVASINFCLSSFIGIHAAALIFLVAIVVLALFVGRGPTLLAATLSAIILDYFFLPPVFEFRLTHATDALLLAAYFIVAFVLWQLIDRTQAQERAKGQVEERARALYLLIHELAGAAPVDEILEKIIQQMRDSFKTEIAVILSPDPLCHECHTASTFRLSESDQRNATWTARHGCSSISFSDDAAEFRSLFLPLKTKNGRLGVIGLRLKHVLTRHQRSLLDAFAKQIALALDRHNLQEQSEKAKWLAESERLSKTMLNSISHEIRTPISVIKNATSNLIDVPDAPLTDSQQQIVAEIQQANERLDRLVGKALDMTRLESGRVKPKITPCDVTDLVHVAVKETRKELTRHKVTVELGPALPLVNMDFVMTEQALMNLLSNAAIHTPANTNVSVSARVDDRSLILEVADSGPGIPRDSLPLVFEKFYRCPHAPTGGTGLGLSLVKGFTEAQGGHVMAANRREGGAIFTIYLPLEIKADTDEEAKL